MILGIGTDIVEVKRFEAWAGKDGSGLEKIFTERELADCRYPEKSEKDLFYSPEKLAVRFAAKEAGYKTLSNALIYFKKNNKEFGFLGVANCFEIVKEVWGVPSLLVNWDLLSEKVGIVLPADVKVHLSLSHEKSHVIAFVLFERA